MYPHVIASEAIHFTAQRKMDCFASLAMTWLVGNLVARMERSEIRGGVDAVRESRITLALHPGYRLLEN